MCSSIMKEGFQIGGKNISGITDVGLGYRSDIQKKKSIRKAAVFRDTGSGLIHEKEDISCQMYKPKYV